MNGSIEITLKNSTKGCILDPESDPFCDYEAFLQRVTCPLTGKIFKEPVSAPNGLIYESDAIMLFIQQSQITSTLTLFNLTDNKEITFPLNDTKFVLEKSDLMEKTVLSFLEKYPNCGSMVYSTEMTSPKTSEVRYSINFAKEVSDDKAYFEKISLGQDTTGIKIEDHANFYLESLLSSADSMRWLTPLDRFINLGTKDQIFHMISNLSYSVTDEYLIKKFMLRIIKAMSTRVNYDQAFIRANATHSPDNTHGLCEMISKHLFDCHPIFKTIIFPTQEFNSALFSNCNSGIGAVMLKCGFKYNLETTLRIFSKYPLSATSDIMASTCARENQLEVIDVVLKSTHMNSHDKIGVVEWIRSK